MEYIYKKIGDTALYYAWTEVMYTRLDIVLSHHDEAFCTTEANRILKCLSHIEEIGNHFDRNSELSIVNSLAHNAPVQLSDELYNILSLCHNYWSRTAGHFDITVSESSRGRMAEVKLDERSKSVSTPDILVQFDLSGFLKGYGLDKIKVTLEESGIKNALISLGNSSILAIGNHPCGDGWNITAQDSAPERAITLKDSFLTTSSNLSTGKHHLISPISGAIIDVDSKFSVTSASGAEGEVFTTAIAVAQASERSAILTGMDKRLINKGDHWELYG